MSDASKRIELSGKNERGRGRSGRGAPRFADGTTSTLEINVGRSLRRLRKERQLSMSALAEASELNINTLSLIENGKISPSVSTLQKVALALDVPMAAFFGAGEQRKKTIYQKAGQRPRAAFAHGALEDLGTELASRWAEPFVVTLEAGADSGETPIVHTGLEFIYCLEGSLTYTVEAQEYILDPGDSLLFEARLPHSWQNTSTGSARSLLILCPADERDRPARLHFGPD